jgi:AcrR family transcriptional regulator
MPYRPTERTEAKRREVRERIVVAAHELIARGGYRAASVSAVAHRAGVATGSVYRHFPSKADLFAEVFRRASQREVDAMAAATAADGPVTVRLAAGVERWARRALRGRRLAWALLAEPVDPAVEAERLAFRRAYRDLMAGLIREGVDSGELPDQDPDVTAAALIGAIGEALVGPLSPAGERTDGVRRARERTGGDRSGSAGRAGEPGDDAQNDTHLVAALKTFCLRSVTDKEPAHVRDPLPA